MQTEADTLTFSDGGQATENGGLMCEGCGRVYEKAILVNVISEGRTQEYYACPICMTKAPEALRIKESQSSTETVREKKTKTSEKEAVEGCANYFGYLKKREKDKPFPDECLTCSRMVDCLVH